MAASGPIPDDVADDEAEEADEEEIEAVDEEELDVLADVEEEPEELAALPLMVTFAVLGAPRDTPLALLRETTKYFLPVKAATLLIVICTVFAEESPAAQLKVPLFAV